MPDIDTRANLHKAPSCLLDEIYACFPCLYGFLQSNTGF